MKQDNHIRFLHHSLLEFALVSPSYTSESFYCTLILHNLSWKFLLPNSSCLSPHYFRPPYLPLNSWSPLIPTCPQFANKIYCNFPFREMLVATLDLSSLPNLSLSTYCSMVIIYLMAYIHLLANTFSNISFSLWLISFRMIFHPFSCKFHDVIFINSRLILYYSNVSYFFIHSPAEGQLGYLKILAVMNKAATNSLDQVSCVRMECPLGIWPRVL